MKFFYRFTGIFIVSGLLAGACHSSRKEAVKTPVSEVREIHIDNLPKAKPVEKERPRQEKKKKKTSVAPKIVEEARRWVGTRYRYGGNSRQGTDCSGLTSRIYGDIAGIKLPRDSRSQQAFVEPVKRKDLVPGDLLFFATRSGGSRVGHVGIYVGDGDFIHASTSKGVIVSNLSEKYYETHYHSAGRVPGIDGQMPEMESAAPAESPQITLDRLIELMESGDNAGGESDTIGSIVKQAF